MMQKLQNKLGSFSNDVVRICACHRTRRYLFKPSGFGVRTLSVSRANHLPPSRIYQSPTQDLHPRSPVCHSDSSSWKAYQSGNHEPYKPKPLTSGHLKSESNAKIRQETDKNGPIDLSCIDGIKPIQRLNEGRSIFGKTFKITRKGGEYFCTCKQWKEAKARGIAATCKHLRNAFGGRYETSRIMRMKKNGAMLPSGIGSHSPLETIDSDPKPPDTVADVQTVDDKTVSNAIDSDRISDGTHDPNSLITDSARSLSLKLKDMTLSKQSENAVDINKLMDDSFDLESKPASIKPPKPRAKKADPQKPRAKSAEFDSTTSSDMTGTHAPNILQSQENGSSTFKETTLNKQIHDSDGDKLPENPSDLESKPDSKKSRKTRAKKADAQLPDALKANPYKQSDAVDETAGDLYKLEPKADTKKSGKTCAKKSDPQLLDATSAELGSVTPLTLASEFHASDLLQSHENDVPAEVPTKNSKSGAKKKPSESPSKSRKKKYSEEVIYPELNFDHTYGDYTRDPASDVSTPTPEMVNVQRQPATSAVLDLVHPSADFEASNALKVENSNETKAIDEEDGSKVAAKPKKAKKSKIAKAKKSDEESEDVSDGTSHQELQSMEKSTDRVADDASPIDAEVGPKPKKAKKLKSAKISKGVKEWEEMTAEPSLQNIESIAESSSHVAEDAKPIDVEDGQNVAVLPKKAKRSKSAKPSKGAKESEEVPAERFPQKLDSIAKSNDQVDDDANPIDAEDIAVHPKKAKKSKTAKRSKRVEESEDISAEPSTENLESIAKSADHGVDDARPIDAEGGLIVNVQPKQAKKWESAEPSKGVKESEEMSTQPSPQKLESITQSTDHVADDASSMDANDGPTVAVQLKKAEKLKPAKTSKGVKESEETSAEPSPQKLESIATSDDRGADDASPEEAQKPAKKSTSSKTSKGDKESKETSAELSPPKFESIAESAIHVAEDARPIDSADEQNAAVQPKRAKTSKSIKTKHSEGAQLSEEISDEPSFQLDSETIRGQITAIAPSVESNSLLQNDGTKITKARAKKAEKPQPETIDPITSADPANQPEDAESIMDASAEMYTSKGRENRAKIKSQQPPLLLAHKYDPEKTDPSGYWVSEKLDGIRTFWDHERGQFFSRLGNPFTAPDWFKEAMPKDLSLDGELFAGRGKFVETISVVKTLNSPDWEKVEYHIFDSPSMTELPFEARMDQLKQVVASSNCKHLKLLPQEPVESKEHVEKLLKQIESKGGEGLMLRKPGSLYVGKRSSTLLKVKSFYDAEAVVIAHEPGRGKYSRVTGSLRCRMESGKEFRIGTGLSDLDREAPPSVGAIVTYRFQELTRDGIPRFPSFVGERVDADRASDATVRIVQ